MLPRSLSDFTGPSHESGTQTVFQNCPVCGNDRWKLYVDMLTGRWYCFAGEHGSGGSVAPGALTNEARRLLLDQMNYDAQGNDAWPEVLLPPWEKLSDMAARYCARRRICIKPEHQVVEMKNEHRIVFPFFGPNRRVISWVARCYMDAEVSPGNPKYKQNPGPKPVYMLPAWEQVNDAVLVEGVVDALAVWHATNTPVIAIGGTKMSNRTERDVRQLVRKRVAVMLDGDGPGVKGAFTVYDQLIDRFNVTVVSPHLPEGVDPGDMEPGAIREVLSRWL